MPGFKITQVHIKSIAQFFMCIGLVICALLVRQQLQFLRDKSPGFNKENVLLLSDPGVKLGGNPESFLSELKRNPDILSASVCGDYPNSGNDNFPISANYRMGTPDLLIANFSASYDFLKTFGIKLLEGRDFDRQLDNDTVRRVILNAAAVKELGMGNPVNRFINTRYLNSLDIKTVRYQVIGVAADFNFKSLHKTIQPMAIFLRNWGQYIAIRLSGNSIRHTIGYIEKEWQSFVPGAAFEYHFLDERIDRLYKTEAVLSNILLILTGLIVLVAVMGLAGLTLLTVQQRTKEIGIRKVVGASVGDIVFLFSRDYARWIGVSFVLAASVAWFVMHRWLLGFAYRIDISWWVFAVSGLAAALMAFAIIGAQVTRAAGVSPVKSLRAE